MPASPAPPPHRRQVRAIDGFFDDLAAVLPAERSPDGSPSLTDFLAFEMPAIVDLLATNFEANTISQPNMFARVMIKDTPVFGVVAIYAELDPNDVVLVVGFESDR